MLIDAALAIILLGLLGGGRLKRFGELPLKGVWIFITAAFVQFALLLAGWLNWPWAAQLGPALYLSSFVALLGALWVNRRLPGLRLVGLGVALNFLVIAANGGAMPVDRELAVQAGSETLVAMLDSDNYVSHVAADQHTRLRPLADILPLPMLFPRPRFFSPGSIGDIFITIGACWLLLVGMGAFGLHTRERISVG